VAELSLGQLKNIIETVACGRVPVYGLNKIDGEPITPDEVIAKIKEVQHVS
jgi:2-oxoglutarate ferredoxin oxidoreductase subunit alpha